MAFIRRQPVWPMAVVLIFLASASTAFPRPSQTDSPQVTASQSTDERLADFLLQATPAERDARLAAEPSSLTPALVSAVNEAGDRLLRAQQYAAAADAF